MQKISNNERRQAQARGFNKEMLEQAWVLVRSHHLSQGRDKSSARGLADLVICGFSRDSETGEYHTCDDPVAASLFWTFHSGATDQERLTYAYHLLGCLNCLQIAKESEDVSRERDRELHEIDLD